MSRPKYLAPTIFIILAGAVIALATQEQRGNEQKNARVETPDFSRFPIVDFQAPETVDPTQSAAREAKGRKYNSKYMPQLSDDTYQVFSTTDWDVRLPALPVERSAAIVIGTVRSAHAYVTPDKTGIYSEFEVAVDAVIKNDPKNMINADASLTVERKGGRARMPSGRIVISWVSHQNMPRVGGRYLFFLTHDFQTPNDTGKDFYILTGYELRDGKIGLLDDTQPGHPITRYNGATETALLTDLFNAVAKSSAHSN